MVKRDRIKPLFVVTLLLGLACKGCQAGYLLLRVLLLAYFRLLFGDRQHSRDFGALFPRCLIILRCACLASGTSHRPTAMCYLAACETAEQPRTLFAASCARVHTDCGRHMYVLLQTCTNSLDVCWVRVRLLGDHAVGTSVQQATGMLLCCPALPDLDAGATVLTIGRAKSEHLQFLSLARQQIQAPPLYPRLTHIQAG